MEVCCVVFAYESSNAGTDTRDCIADKSMLPSLDRLHGRESFRRSDDSADTWSAYCRQDPGERALRIRKIPPCLDWVGVSNLSSYWFKELFGRNASLSGRNSCRRDLFPESRCTMDDIRELTRRIGSSGATASKAANIARSDRDRRVVVDADGANAGQVHPNGVIRTPSSEVKSGPATSRKGSSGRGLHPGGRKGREHASLGFGRHRFCVSLFCSTTTGSRARTFR